MARDYSAWVDLEANGAGIASNAFGAADDSAFDMAADGGGRNYLQVEAEITYATAPTAGTPVALHHAPQDLFGGTNDGRDPSATNLGGWLYSMIVENTTTTQRFRFDLPMPPASSKYWLHNAGTGQTISSGWKLRARAWNPA